MRRNVLATDVMLRKAKIADASRLVKQGVLHMSGNDAQEYIRAGSLRGDIDDYYGEGFFARVISSEKDQTRKTFSISTIITSEDDLFSFTDELVRKCFFKEDARKISIVITSLDAVLERVLSKIGFIQEALLRDEVLVQSDGVSYYMDAGLFSLQRSEYTGYNVCFVPFQRGIVAVTGGKDFVDGVFFLTYETVIEDKLIFDAAWYQGLTDDSGKLLSRNDIPRDLSAHLYAFMPEEVLKAYDELKDFFLKKRYDFDIKTRVYDCTDFQVSVWDEIKKIPYGVTCSYEDIALELTNNDLAKARLLTRAVGKACSENPVPIIVPCHRVIGKNGKLVGFSGGVEFKDFLLQNELFAAAFPLN